MNIIKNMENMKNNEKEAVKSENKRERLVYDSNEPSKVRYTESSKLNDEFNEYIKNRLEKNEKIDVRYLELYNEEVRKHKKIQKDLNDEVENNRFKFILKLICGILIVIFLLWFLPFFSDEVKYRFDYRANIILANLFLYTFITTTIFTLKIIIPYIKSCKNSRREFTRKNYQIYIVIIYMARFLIGMSIFRVDFVSIIDFFIIIIVAILYNVALKHKEKINGRKITYSEFKQNVTVNDENKIL